VGQLSVKQRQKELMAKNLLAEIRHICEYCSDEEKQDFDRTLKDPRRCQCRCARIAGFKRNIEQLMPFRH